MIRADVDTSGPIFDGRATIIIRQGTDELAQAVAEEGQRLVKDDLTKVIRTHPTGRYIPSVEVVRRGHADFTYGTRIIYGPWIEGTGSRNKTTRFKGYASFRRTRQVLENRIPEIERRVMPRIIGELNA